MRMENVFKSFGKVIALKNCNINIYEGKVMALLGENGAGKSTTIKCMTGIHQPTRGGIWWKGERIHLKDVNSSKKLGMAVVHQELKLQNFLTVWENVFLGNQLIKFGLINKSLMIKKTNRILGLLNVQFSANEIVENLTIGNQQMVEIAKALAQEAKFIILDEPTDALTEKESNALFKVINSLKEKGYTFLYITHRLKEISEICDYVTIFRDGEFIVEDEVKNLNENKIISYMVGRKLEEQFPKPSKILSNKNALEVKNISSEFTSINSFSLKKGEILGFSGLMGSGRTELMKTIISEFPKSTGTIKICGKEVKIKSIKNSIKEGIYYVTENRKKEGLFLGKDLTFNTTISRLNFFSSGTIIREKQEEKVTNDYIKLFNIRTPGSGEIVGNLSGGNQQKVLLSKAILTNPKVLILDEPTRGIDVGARREIYDEIVKLKSTGIGIILVSSDMPELIGLCDRIAVMANNKIQGFIKNEKRNASQKEILKLSIKGG